VKAVVVLPTYNERDNLEAMVDAVLALPGSFSVLVVDDASPDGTGDLANELAERHGARLSVLHRTRKEGLGRAYAEAFGWAVENGADLVFQMDCDFSHDPADLVRLREPLESGAADLVLGSRYTGEGGTEGWGVGRQFLSRWGSFYARTWLRLPQRDLTGGFKGWRGDLLRVVDAGAASARGYAFQVEMTQRAVRSGARVTEIPIVFTERRAGDSKMSLAVAFEACWRVPLLAVAPPRVAAFETGAAA
jgi:dolichol-phosphate mannosyltransferase